MHSPSFNPDFIQFSHGGRYYIAAEDCYSREVRIWEIPDKLIQVFTPTVDGVEWCTRWCDVTFDGKYVAACLGDLVKVWETRTLREVFTHPINDCGCINFSPDGSLLAVASYEDMVRILSIPDGSTLAIIEHDGVGWCFFSSDGNYLITASRYIKVWQPE